MRSSRVDRLALGIDGKAMLLWVRPGEDGEIGVARVRPFRCEPMRCGRCGEVSPGYDRGEGLRQWRAMDWGPMPMFIEAEAPRVWCARHGATVIAVPWARHGARHTRDFDAAVAWHARHGSKSMVATLLRIAWVTVGVIIARVMVDAEVGQDRFANLRRIGIDEVSYRKGHKYLVVVVDHATGRLVWAGDGRKKRTLGEFFDLLGEERCERIALVSADGADYIADMVGLRCPNARLCLDPFHVVKWVVDALDGVRRRVTSAARRTGDMTMVGQLKDSRWALVKNPENLNDGQKTKLADIQKANNQLYRAYLLKEQFREIWKPGGEERVLRIAEWLRWAQRSQIPEFVELARKMRRYEGDITNSLVHRLSNGLVEGLNSRVRLIINIARGFRSVEALLAMLNLHLSGYAPTFPGRS